MPIYVWESDCLEPHVLEVYRTISRRHEPPTDDEGARPGAEYRRCVAGVTSTQKEWHKPIYSDAMAINPEDVAAHRKAHPSIPVMKDGRIGPITSHHQHQRIMKELGFVNRS